MTVDPPRFSESMFVLVSQRADGNWYPVARQGCLALFSTAEAATTFLHRTKDIPPGANVSRESGWGRVVGVMRLARDEGATLVAVDLTDSVKAVPLEHAMKGLESMLEQVALTATALLRSLLIICAAKMGTPKPNMTLADGVDVLGRVVRVLAPKGEMADAAKSIDVFMRSLAGKAAGVKSAPRVPFIPEGAVGAFIPWVEARIDRLPRGRG